MVLFGHRIENNDENVVKCKAGKMNLELTSTWVLPDDRPGQLYLYTAHDEKIHVCWKCRNSNVLEDHFTLLPKNAFFFRVEKCLPSRVYVLFTLTGKKYFYWMQEPNAASDDIFIFKANEMLSGKIAFDNNLQGLSVQEEIHELLQHLQEHYPEVVNLLAMDLGHMENVSMEGNYDVHSSNRGSIPLTISQQSSITGSLHGGAYSLKRQEKVSEDTLTDNVKHDDEYYNLNVCCHILNDVIHNQIQSLSENKDNEFQLETLLPDDKSTDFKTKLIETINSPHFYSALKAMTTFVLNDMQAVLKTYFGIKNPLNGSTDMERLLNFAINLETIEEEKDEKIKNQMEKNEEKEKE